MFAAEFLAASPTTIDPSGKYDTYDAVIRLPVSYEANTSVFPIYVNATAEYVVPKSIPITGPLSSSLSYKDRIVFMYNNIFVLI